MLIFGLDSSAEWFKWAAAAVILVIFFILAFLSRLLMAGVMRLLAHRTETQLDDMIVHALRGPLYMVLVVTGIWLALLQIPELVPYRDPVHDAGVILLLILATIAVVRVVNAVLICYGSEIAPRTAGGLDNKIVPLLQRVSKVVIYAIGLLIILDQLNVNISPILAGLGIGGLAVALALQSTLSNFLAGTYVISDAIIHIGDYIMLDSGQDGFVEDIGWRTTKLRNWQGNLIIFPNSKLAEAIVTDFEKPEKAMLFSVGCGVSYESDLSKVERVAMQVAEETMRKYPEGVKDFKPVLRFKSFGDSNIDFDIILKAIDRAAHYYLKSEFIKALHKRFAEEGIEIQYPVRKLLIGEGQNSVLPSARQKNMGGVTPGS